jgi:hypothetical protein
MTMKGKRGKVAVLALALALGVLISAVELGIVKWSFLRPLSVPVTTVSCLVGCVLPIRYIIFSGKSELSNGAKWRVSVVTVAFLLGPPAIFVFLATSGGGGGIAVIVKLVGGSPGLHLLLWNGPEVACLLAITYLVVFIPEILHSNGRTWRTGSPVPGWLAGFAAVAAAAAILVMHFGGGVLAKSHVDALCAAAFGVAALLVPFYRVVANKCWRDGVAVAFDPWQWWSAWRAAYHEMKGKTDGEVKPSSEQIQVEEVHTLAGDGRPNA